MDLYNVRRELSSGKSIYEMPLKVTYYARVSTDKDEQLNSLQNQIDYYKNYIKNNSNWTFVDGYVDEGISGSRVNKRESFLRMIKDAELGMFDFIVTKEISRFSRNTLDSIKYTQELLKHEVGVLFQSDNINTLLADSELRLTIMASIAQDEIRKLSERVKFGHKQAIKNGVVLGNDKIWGYKKEKGKLVVVEEQAVIVRRIYDLYVNKKIGMRTISKVLAEEGHFNSNKKPFSPSTIKNILINPKYKGYYCGKKTEKKDYRLKSRKMFKEHEWVMYEDNEHVPPIISEKLFEKANDLLKSRSPKNKEKRNYQSRYTYSGKIKCGKCKEGYHRGLYRYASGNKEYYSCKTYKHKGKKFCDNDIIYTEELNEIMSEMINELVKNKFTIIDDLIKIYEQALIKTDMTEEISKLEISLDDINDKKEKLLDLTIKGIIDDKEFGKRNNKLNNEIEKIEKLIETKKHENEKSKTLERDLDVLRKIITQELNFENGFSESIISTLVNEIIIDNKDGNMNVKVILKGFDLGSTYRILRKKGKSLVNKVDTSLWYTSSI